MKYTLPVVIVRLENGDYLARCEDVRATAIGDTPSEAVANLRESIEQIEKKRELVFSGSHTGPIRDFSRQKTEL
ncbi:type II toxin-antitoxin system HicB family antitoxin [Desulfoglaeba alkanexedens]|jgi:predicted RNase H-like HicB family nuclease|uniref:Type II toxin-antitoxin system HicB family antitoxin n=1 Tax=Desulfoglaeba alkanexedens ALDC TaxID=980445 RepID=A0A4P8KZ91_9BACT|nr:type II toxin-antitoxin system HicB family antitoxin [Desulfoglaeba alkanexedens]QCQ20849.1 type II toxin-antitoxin system HicB family antitoxin [Desulfoglaeba alkanexedens ALDC]